MFTNFKKSIANFRRSQQTINELSALNDRELADLGISRSQIRSIARQSVYG